MNQVSSKKLGRTSSAWSWFFWSLGAAFFAAEYFARVAPAVMVPQLIHDFHINAIAIGTLAAAFYYPYILMQIPVGIIYDTYSVHKVLGVMVITCAIGALLFTLSHVFWVLIVARMLMGLTAAFAFIGALKIATLRFKPEMLGLLAGLTQGMGMFGAAISEDVFGSIIKTVGWRSVMGIITAILFLIAILMLIFIRDKYLYTSKFSAASIQQGHYWDKLKQDCRIVFSNKDGWINSIYASLLYAPTGAFAALWGIAFLQKFYHQSLGVAAFVCSMIFLGWAIFGPIIGRLSDRAKKRRPFMIFSSLLACVTLSIIIYVPHLPLTLLYILAFMYGIGNSGVSLAYAVAGEINPIKVSGLSIAFTNMLSILTTPGLQQIVGLLLVLNWNHQLQSGAPMYSLHDFHHALLVLPFISLLSFLCAFLTKETHCQRKDF